MFSVARLKLMVLCYLLGLVIASAPSFASSQVNGLRIWHSPDNTRVVFDVSANLQYEVFSLENPLRVVVDIENTQASGTLPSLDSDNPHIANIRIGRPSSNTLRYVFDLKQPLANSDFVLSPNELYGHRLVVDLTDRGRNKSELSSTPQAPPQQALARENAGTLQTPRPFMVAVDAGHGGEDPGALGFRGTHEKRITLQIAKKLVAAINQNGGMQAFLVREGDYYIKLHKRRSIARARSADMFISIHADAFTKQSANGFSVFALSQRGATSAMASALAAKENASDRIGGVSLADKDDVLAKVLVDLSMTNTISESVNFGGRVLKELGKLGRLHSKRVEQAGFAVLKSADIPSVLIETGFITNPDEEARLRSNRYQNQVADAINTAIIGYVEQSPFTTSARYAAATKTSSGVVYQSLVKPKRPTHHKVKRGDSLSTIAERYGLSIRRLKQLNALRGETVYIGQRLKVSGGSSQSSTVSSPQTIRPKTHVVRRGESLSLISAKYNVTIKSLKNANNLRGETVFVGQKLKIPGGTTQLAKKPRVHVVKRGDTLSEIAEAYSTSMRGIMRANKMRSRTVRLGQRLTIP